MDFNTYQQLAERTANKAEDAQRYANFGLGIAGEAGEVADLLKKHVFHGHALDAGALVKELGDVLWYVAVIANTAGFSLEEVAEWNIGKLRKRYPDGFSSECSIHREE